MQHPFQSGAVAVKFAAYPATERAAMVGELLPKVAHPPRTHFEARAGAQNLAVSDCASVISRQGAGPHFADRKQTVLVVVIVTNLGVQGFEPG